MQEQSDPTDVMTFLGPEARGVELLLDQLQDPKTGMYSYSLMLQLLEREYYRFEAYQEPFSIVLCEMERLSTSGSREALPSDILLVTYLRMRLVIGKPDMIGHFADDSLLLLLPGKRPAEAVALAGKAMKTVTASALSNELHKRTLRLSFGIAGLPDNGYTLNQLFLAAKAAQLQAREKKFPVQPYRGHAE